MSDVKIVRLNDGTEILADVVISGTDITLKNPTLIAVAPNPKNGQMDVHMAPFLPLALKKEITFPLNKVLFVYETVPEIVNKYNTIFGSGILVPNTSVVGSPGIISG